MTEEECVIHRVGRGTTNAVCCKELGLAAHKELGTGTILLAGRMCRTVILALFVSPSLLLCAHGLISSSR